jgi:hypothetical protein
MSLEDYFMAKVSQSEMGPAESSGAHN